MSKNAEGWIRHRGGKCPVEDGMIVEVRRRSGNIERLIDLDVYNTEEKWLHFNDSEDIMVYRLHKPAEQVDGGIYAADDSVSTEQVAVSYIGESVQGPLQWRDRITEIDATTQALTAERADLVQKLAGEGFALIGRVVEPVEDMSDWRNWKAGDLLEMVRAKTWADMTDGKLYKITQKTDGEFSFIDDVGDVRTSPDTRGSEYAKDFKWHSRPSA